MNVFCICIRRIAIAVQMRKKGGSTLREQFAQNNTEFYRKRNSVLFICFSFGNKCRRLRGRRSSDLHNFFFFLFFNFWFRFQIRGFKIYLAHTQKSIHIIYAILL